MSGRRLLGICTILLACACAGPGAGPRELPEATRALAICLYNTLKTTPGIVAVDAFVQDVPRRRAETYAVIGYWVRDKTGKLGMSRLELSAPKDRGHFAFSLAEAAGGDRYFEMADQLASKCQALAAYNDQILVIVPSLPPLQKVDMARYAN